MPQSQATFISIEMDTDQGFSPVETLAIQHAHPTKLVCHALAGLWLVYFLWCHLVLAAILIPVVLAGIGSFAARNADPRELIKTPLGKLAYVMLDPFGLAFQFAGYLVIGYGTWEHYGSIVLIGVSFVIASFVFGWDRLP